MIRVMTHLSCHTHGHDQGKKSSSYVSGYTRQIISQSYHFHISLHTFSERYDLKKWIVRQDEGRRERQNDVMSIIVANEGHSI